LQRTQIQHAYDAAQWLLTMITDLLDLSRIETGNLAVTMTAVDVSALLIDVKTMLAADAMKMAVEIELPEMGSSAWVHADRARLYQVLVNLLSNAIKYNRRGGRARVSILEAPAPGQVRITVEDCGAGLSEQQIEHLFEPFNRLGREGQSVSGSGIGLVISRHLVHLIGGQITVESQPGIGSRFSVDLLRADRGAAALPAQPDALAAPRQAQGELVLYVEDDPVNELLMRAIVEGRLGRRYASASTAEAGLLMARELRPAVMLVDLNLGGRDGIWLARQIRSDPQLRGICLIAATADATPQTRARLLSSGFIDCWIKPIDIKTVDIGLTLHARPPLTRITCRI
jgi:CheY-like chemotaxis protein